MLAQHPLASGYVSPRDSGERFAFYIVIELLKVALTLGDLVDLADTVTLRGIGITDAHIMVLPIKR